MTLCACGCGGEKVPDKTGRIRGIYLYGHSRIGKKYSDETRDKISKSKLGKSNANKGKPMSEENKSKLRGLKRTAETCLKISISKKGKPGKGHPVSDCTKKLLQLIHKGHHYSPNTEFKPLNTTPLHNAIRNSQLMHEWKSLIKDWDNYTCQKCGVRGGKLESHHINRVSDIIKEYALMNMDQAITCGALWDVGNGITYCEECHDLLKMRGGLL
jgi:hypothetical protein